MQDMALHILQEAKNLLNLIEDDSRDDLLKSIINNVYGRLLTYTGYTVLPKQLVWIVVELTCSRYNLLGSEGVHSELNEGIQYIYNSNLLDEYREEIDRFVANNPPSNRKRFRMM
ncbi:MAG: phage head-tail connector protein [Romboutsia timonensis]